MFRSNPTEVRQKKRLIHYHQHLCEMIFDYLFRHSKQLSQWLDKNKLKSETIVQVEVQVKESFVPEILGIIDLASL